VAYIGVDGNVWLVNAMDLEQVQLTQDAAGYSTTTENTPVVIYQRPRWSSDGMLLAYERQDGQPTDSGFNFQNSLWVFNLATKESRSVLQGEQLAGFDWKPGTHLIAFGQSIDPNYFSRQGPNAEFAKGLRQINVDSGETVDLVQPERGLHLAIPKWSPDGRFISFREIYIMEGSGKFAVYDLAAQSYLSWDDEPVGGYTWSRDGETIVYDDLTYIPEGDEALYIRPRAGGDSRRLSPQIENGYAYSPVYAPDSEVLAYLADMDAFDGNLVSLFIIESPDQEPREIGQYENAGYLSWTPGWHHIVLTQGPFDNAEILLISPYDGSVTVLANGSEPQWNPAAGLQ